MTAAGKHQIGLNGCRYPSGYYTPEELGTKCKRQTEESLSLLPPLLGLYAGSKAPALNYTFGAQSLETLQLRGTEICIRPVLNPSLSCETHVRSDLLMGGLPIGRFMPGGPC